jgi:hypothetical protein
MPNRNNYVSPTYARNEYRIGGEYQDHSRKVFKGGQQTAEEDVQITDRSGADVTSARHRMSHKGQYSFAGGFPQEE